MKLAGSIAGSKENTAAKDDGCRQKHAATAKNTSIYTANISRCRCRRGETEREAVQGAEGQQSPYTRLTIPGNSLRIAANRRTALRASSPFPRQRCENAELAKSFTAQTEREMLGEAAAEAGGWRPGGMDGEGKGVRKGEASSAWSKFISLFLSLSHTHNVSRKPKVIDRRNS